MRGARTSSTTTIRCGVDLPVEATTILPRPFAFNTLAALNRHRDLLDLEKGGAVPGMEGKGSVLCVTIGRKDPEAAQMPRGQGDETKALFKKIISDYLETRPGATIGVQDFLRENYPDFV